MKKVLLDNLVFLILSIVIFVYIVLRALLIPAYHDEINTFFLYVQTGEFQPFYSVVDQNNHVLNTLFSHLFFLVFGDHLFVLRLANVLSSLVYLYFVWKIGKTFKTKTLAVSWFLTMVSSLYFISFFSLSRGYGMSMAFIIASIYYLIEIFSGFSYKSLLLGLFTSVLALWAYLGLMIPVLLLGGMFISLFLWTLYNSKNFKPLIFVVPGLILLFFIPLYYAITYSFYVKTHSTIFGSYGAGFFQSVIFSVIDEFAGKENSLPGRITMALILLSLVVSGVISLKKNRLKSPSTLLHILLWGTLSGIIAMNLLIGVDYPTSRMAAFLFVLLIVALYQSINDADNNLTKYSGYLISSVFLLQFILTFNFSYAPCWKYDTLTASMYSKIAAEAEKTGILPTISANEILGREFFYHDFTNDGQLNSSQSNDFPSKIADFIIAHKFTKQNSFPDYDTVEYNKTTKVFLLQRKSPYNWSEVNSFANSLIEGDSEYMSFIPDLDCEPYRGRPFCFDIEFNAQSQRFPFRCYLTCDVWDKSNKSLSMNMLELQVIHSDVSQQTHFHRRQYLSDIPMDASKIRFYFFNGFKTEIKISDLKIRFYTGEGD